jgi:hypothetical protein
MRRAGDYPDFLRRFVLNNIYTISKEFDFLRYP